ncbi:rhodanese-like domain-containing protein [Glutamicibacter sp. MNS18]|uniref:MBL fold metallo-hydrolase n=1 Tax=Glutamicibacter sp. MNS18 TaxID=2989817 RepID=UPI00223606F0|nr:MBL fold metallo-hydrolase [Glutamicibacter sp. MNS18]MCW4466063.1 rhodanese-like domain-containing protein [Glutamicibacter sp. MNS18]
MLLERFYDEDLAQASYFIGCQAKGEAVVVDPRRDIAGYLELAAKHGMSITAVTETHIHADYLSGTRELAAATGAAMYVSGEGGVDWQYGFDAERLMDRDTITLGNITLTARHTPGHTPEHLSFLVTDGAFSPEPGYLLSGDFVFAGDLGRPDLLDEAAGGVDTRFAGARQLFASLQQVFLELPDHVQVHPAHGSGSACGKALGAVPSTTVGYERQYAWWASYLAQDNEEGFVAALLENQPDAHAYFGRMKRQNRDGAAILGPLGTLPELAPEQVNARLADGTSVFVDTREHTQVLSGTVAGALAIPGPGKMATFGGWAFDPERDGRSLVVLARDAKQADEMRDHLIRVGIDRVAGYATTLHGLPAFTPPQVHPLELGSLDYAALVDVRNRNEYNDGHIPGARWLSASQALWKLDQLPRDGAIVTYCQGGTRNAVVASALRAAGYDVVELAGSYAGWQSRMATA